jgi:ribosomal protein L12E/L44/L45/RPP1/RPP2
MSKTEPQRQSQPPSPPQSQVQSQVRPGQRAPALTGVSMRDLLASCAAATAISTPPSAPAPEPERHRPVREHRAHREAA